MPAFVRKRPSRGGCRRASLAGVSDEKKGGLALIAANLAGMATMALHPLPRQMADPHTRVLNVAVHALAMLSAPLALTGGIAFARRTGSLSAVVFQGFALVAALLATAMSGLVATALLQQSAPHELLLMTGALNQAFSRTFAVGTSVALVLWSIAVARAFAATRACALRHRLRLALRRLRLLGRAARRPSLWRAGPGASYLLRLGRSDAARRPHSGCWSASRRGRISLASVTFV